jgi:hypothetical protein
VRELQGRRDDCSSLEDTNESVVENVVKKSVENITLENGEQALTIFGDHIHLYANPSDEFIVDGLSGRCWPHRPQDHR